MCKLVTIQTNFGDSIHVAEIKKNSIQNIVNSAVECKDISGIIVFGSSLEECCTEESDIDIAIISKKNVNELSKLLGFKRFLSRLYEVDNTQEYDRLYFKSIEEIEKQKNIVPICKELMQKGKLIYRRKEIWRGSMKRYSIIFIRWD